MPRLQRIATAAADFMKHVHVNPTTKCWEWELSLFRFRVGEYVHNPRRFCAYIQGYNLPLGRNVRNGCLNDKCVNPEHTVLKHNGAPIQKGVQLLLTLEELKLGSNYLRHRYQRTMQEMRNARIDTLQLIIRIKHTTLKRTAQHIADELGINPNFVNEVRKLTANEFNALKDDPYDNGLDPDEDTEEDLPPDAHRFHL